MVGRVFTSPLLSLAWAAAAVAGMVAACTPSVPIHAYLERRTAAICAWKVSCGLVVADAHCRGIEVVDAFEVATLDAVVAGRAHYDGTAAHECLAGLAARGCTVFDLYNRAPRELGVCAQVFEGTVGTGGACRSSDECSSAFCNVPTNPVDGPTCGVGACGTVDRIASIGESCAGGRACDFDAYCADDGNCRPAQQVGEPCGGELGDCEAALHCQGGVGTERGVCRRLVPEGDTCETLYGPGCDRLDNVCFADRCQARRQAGESCQDGAPCVALATCADGTCVPLSLACTFDADCGGAGLECASGACKLTPTCPAD